jgi:hypothetical protein
MPALAWASLLSSATTGEPGYSPQAGKHSTQPNATLGGLKPLDSSSWSVPSTFSQLHTLVSSSTATIQESSRGGGMADTEIQKPTMYFGASTSSSLRPITSTRYTHGTSPVETTPQTSPLEEFTHPGCFFSLTSPFPKTFVPSSLMSQPTHLGQSEPPCLALASLKPITVTMTAGESPKPLRVTVSAEMRRTNSSAKCSSSSSKYLTCTRFDTPLSSATASSETLPSTIEPEHPRPYHPSLPLNPSPLHPHCKARDRLRLWLPSVDTSPTSSTSTAHATIEITEERLNRVLDVIEASWTERTKETYGSGLLVFQVYCDLNHIPEHLCSPVTQPLLSAFIASCAGAYSGSSVSNFVAGICAWHVLHSQPWAVNPNELKSILEGASRLAPHSSKQPKRIPFECNILLLFLTYMDLQSPRDAAIFACLVVTFYSVSRLGEFTVPAINKFSPAMHITLSHVSRLQNHQGLDVVAFHLPATKCSPSGEDTQCAPISHLTDPVTWLDNHLCINAPCPNDHLFAWQHAKGRRPLTKTEVTSRIKELIKQFELPNLKGHSLHIRGTLHYLLQGTPFDVVKTMGRWSGESFTLYLRRHALILAPYLHEHSSTVMQLQHHTMPPVR